MKEKVKAARKGQPKPSSKHSRSILNWIHNKIMHHGHFICKRMQSMAREAYKSQQQRLHSKVNSNIFKNHEINHTQS
jgi:hypothetical protein